MITVDEAEALWRHGARRLGPKAAHIGRKAVNRIQHHYEDRATEQAANGAIAELRLFVRMREG